MDTYILLYLKWITNKDLRYSAGNSAVLCGSLDGRGVWGRKDTWICVAQSLRCLLETTTALLIVYNPKQNKKLTVWGEKVKESSR